VIYSYKYIDHPIQKFHEGINYFFEKLIDLDLGEYDENQHTPAWFKKSVNASSTLLLGNLKSFVTTFHGLSADEKRNIKEVFEANQDIGDLCRGNGHPKKYGAITNEVFRDALRAFYDTLWTRVSKKDNCVNAEVEKICGKIITHYKAFRKDVQHNLKICPFCGLDGMLPSGSVNREAYDHYLPKAQYPFIAVNFKNLAPMCHHCNSTEKTIDDPLEDTGSRRVVVYPFDSLPDDHFEPRVFKTNSYSESFHSTLLKAIDWDIELTSSKLNVDQLEAWDNIFRLKGRYREFLDDYEQTWFGHLLKDYQNRSKAKNFTEFRTEYLKDLKKDIPTTIWWAVRYAYFYFLLYEDDIEEDLNLITPAA
jgi:hypothetical protein